MAASHIVAALGYGARHLQLDAMAVVGPSPVPQPCRPPRPWAEPKSWPECLRLANSDPRTPRDLAPAGGEAYYSSMRITMDSGTTPS